MAKPNDTLRKLLSLFFPPGFLSGSIALLVAAPIMALGITMSIATDWGVGPWDVLHIGIANNTILTIGQANQLAGLLVVAIVLLLRGRTVTIVTLLNVIFVGLWIDLWRGWNAVPYVAGYAGLPYLVLGIIVMGFGVALYLHPNKGAGPRDGLMLTLHLRTGWPVFVIKIVLDLLALVTGYLLGGPVGVGTVLVAFGLGPAIDTFRRLLRRLDEKIRFAGKGATR